MPPATSTPGSPSKVEFETCPVQASLGALGRRRALLVLRNIALLGAQRFNERLRDTPGISKRGLAMRLRELEQEGFIARAEVGRRYTRWALTEKGEDGLPVLMTLVWFGSRWHAPEVFADGRICPLSEIFDESYIRKVLGAPAPSIGRARLRATAESSRPPSATAPT